MGYDGIMIHDDEDVGQLDEHPNNSKHTQQKSLSQYLQTPALTQGCVFYLAINTDGFAKLNHQFILYQFISQMGHVGSCRPKRWFCLNDILKMLDHLLDPRECCPIRLEGDIPWLWIAAVPSGCVLSVL